MPSETRGLVGAEILALNESLLATVHHTKNGQPHVEDLRDKAMLALLSLQVLRTVEI